MSFAKHSDVNLHDFMKGIVEGECKERFLDFGKRMISKNKLYTTRQIDDGGMQDMHIVKESAYEEWLISHKYATKLKHGQLILTQAGKQFILMELI